MCRDDFVVQTGSVRGGCDDTSEGLVRDGADVDHCQVVRRQSCVQCIESDAALGHDIILLGVDLNSEGGEVVSRSGMRLWTRQAANIIMNKKETNLRLGYVFRILIVVHRWLCLSPVPGDLK